MKHYQLQLANIKLREKFVIQQTEAETREDTALEIILSLRKKLENPGHMHNEALKVLVDLIRELENTYIF